MRPVHARLPGAALRALSAPGMGRGPSFPFPNLQDPEIHQDNSRAGQNPDLDARTHLQIPNLSRSLRTHKTTPGSAICVKASVVKLLPQRFSGDCCATVHRGYYITSSFSSFPLRNVWKAGCPRPGPTLGHCSVSFLSIRARGSKSKDWPNEQEWPRNSGTHLKDFQRDLSKPSKCKVKLQRYLAETEQEETAFCRDKGAEKWASVQATQERHRARCLWIAVPVPGHSLARHQLLHSAIPHLGTHLTGTIKAELKHMSPGAVLTLGRTCCPFIHK